MCTNTPKCQECTIQAKQRLFSSHGQLSKRSNSSNGSVLFKDTILMRTEIYAVCSVNLSKFLIKINQIALISVGVGFVIPLIFISD